MFKFLKQITLCAEQNLYGNTHNNTRIRVLPACDFVNRKVNNWYRNSFTESFSCDNTELRHLKQHRSFVYTLLQPVYEDVIFFFAFEIDFNSISNDIFPLRTSIVDNV